MYFLKNNGKMIFDKKKQEKNTNLQKNRINYHSPKIIKGN